MLSKRLRFLIATGFVAVVGVLSFADRAPRASRAILRRIQWLGQRVERRFGWDFVDRSDVPLAYDTAGHFAMWFLAAALGWWLLHHKTSPLVLGLGLVAVSAGIEVGQGFLSSTRTPDVQDLLANAIGVSVGLTLAVLVGVLSAAAMRTFGQADNGQGLAH